MHSSRLITSAFLCLLTAACAGLGKPERPAWIDGASAEHPEQGWLLGRGTAGSQSEAADRARADLAKIFSVQIQAESHDTQTYTEQGGTATSSQSAARTIHTRTDELLRGVQIADYWQDPQTRTWHALAVLSRSRAGQGLRQQIATLDDEIRGYLTQAERGGEIFPRLALLDRAIELQRARAALNQSLQAVALTGQGMPAPWTVGELEARRQALLGQVKIDARGEGEHADSLKAMLGSALSRTGLDVEPDARYILSGRLDYNALPRQGDWHWVRGVLEVELHDRSGISYGVRRWEIKESATDPQTAERRFVSKVQEILDARLVDTMVEFAGQG